MVSKEHKKPVLQQVDEEIQKSGENKEKSERQKRYHNKLMYISSDISETRRLYEAFKLINLKDFHKTAKKLTRQLLTILYYLLFPFFYLLNVILFPLTLFCSWVSIYVSAQSLYKSRKRKDDFNEPRKDRYK